MGPGDSPPRLVRVLGLSRRVLPLFSGPKRRSRPERPETAGASGAGACLLRATLVAAGAVAAEPNPDSGESRLRADHGPILLPDDRVLEVDLVVAARLADKAFPDGHPDRILPRAARPGKRPPAAAIYAWGVSRRGTGGRRFELAGAIWSAGFASGDRFVVGTWHQSPVGPFTDVMWATPTGERVLLASSEAAAAFICGVYEFERVELVPMEAKGSGRELHLAAGPLRLWLRASRPRPIPGAAVWRPWITRWIERPLARPLLGVRTYGVSPTGVREWYRADEYRRLVEGCGRLRGADLGRLTRLHPPVAFGFSEPPRRPSLVRVRPLLQDPSGRLDRLIESMRAARRA